MVEQPNFILIGAPSFFPVMKGFVDIDQYRGLVESKRFGIVRQEKKIVPT
jgi:hypothetical protein